MIDWEKAEMDFDGAAYTLTVPHDIGPRPADWLHVNGDRTDEFEGVFRNPSVIMRVTGARPETRFQTQDLPGELRIEGIAEPPDPKELRRVLEALEKRAHVEAQAAYDKGRAFLDGL